MAEGGREGVRGRYGLEYGFDNRQVDEAPFVGRADELRLLITELGAVASTRASHVLAVTGAPGIGKTRLVAEFRARTRRSAVWLVGRAAPGLSTAPLAPVLQAMGTKQARAGGILRRLAKLAEERPLVLWLDDLHAADAATLELVNRIGRNPIAAPVLVLAALRAEALLGSAQLAGTVGLLIKDGLVRDLLVAPLGEAETFRLAELVLGRSAVTAELGRWLVDRTRGNPLLLVAQVADLAGGAGRGRRATTVQERTRLLLASLSPDAARAAEEAAMLGAPFTAPELLALDQEVGGGLDRLVAAGLLVEEPVSRRLEFVHPVVHEAVYEMTGPARRAELHGLAATRLPLDLGRRAYHLARSARPGDTRAVEGLRRAANDALRRGSPAVAVGHLQDAVALVPATDGVTRAHVLDEIAGAADAAGDHTVGIPALRELLQRAESADHQIASRLRLASFLSAGGGDLAEGERLAVEAVELARARAPQRLSTALTELAWVRGESGHLEGQTALAREALELARAGSDADAQLRALGPLAHGQMLLGRLDVALEATEQAVSIARSSSNVGQLAWHTSVRSEVLAAAGNLEAAIALVAPLAGSERSPTDIVDSNLVRHLWLAGRWDESLVSARRLLAAAPPQVPVRTAWALALAGAIEMASGRSEAARPWLALAERSYGGRHVYSFSALHDWAAGMSAWANDEAAVGVGRLQRSAAWLERMGATGLLAFVLPDLCIVAVAAGATEIANSARTAVEELAVAESPVARAAAWACSAVVGSGSVTEAAAEADAVGLRVLAAMVLSQGNLDEVAAAATRFAAMPAPALEERCREALRAEGARGRRAARQAGSLTSREAEVISLARRGLSTAAIASSLGIGERTVETHLSRSYSKLGIRGRHQLSKPLGPTPPQP